MSLSWQYGEWFYKPISLNLTKKLENQRWFITLKKGVIILFIEDVCDTGLENGVKWQSDSDRRERWRCFKPECKQDIQIRSDSWFQDF